MEISERDRENLSKIITFLEKTEEDAWQLGVCRSKDGSRNCLLGHLFNLGGSSLCDYFEERWATSYMFFPVNDGENPNYQQPTAKARCIAYLNNLLTGKEKTTQDYLEEQ